MRAGAQRPAPATPQPHPPGAQRPKRDPIDPILADELLELATLAPRIARAQPQHHQERQIPRTPRDITKPRQRRIISPLHIIDDDQERATLSPIRAQPKQPVNRRKPIRWRLTRRHTQRPHPSAHPVKHTIHARQLDLTL
jgi:hypothetical protein